MLKEFIEKLEQVWEAGRQIDPTQDVQLVGDGVDIHDMEKYHAQRRRFRGTFGTSLIPDFVRYCETMDVESVFVDHNKMSATGYFDIGHPAAPGHCEHKAVLTLEKTAPFEAWCEITGSVRDQGALQEWVADWMDYIDNSEILYRALTKVTVDSVRNAETTVTQFSEKRSALEQVDVKAQAALPEVVRFTCEPYPDFDPFVFTARLHAHVMGDKVRFTLVRTKQTEEMQALGDLFAGKVRDALVNGGVVGLDQVLVGRFSDGKA